MKNSFHIRITKNFATISYRRLHPDEVYVQTLNISLELWKLVEELLSLLELVFLRPVLHPGIYLLGVETILEADAFEGWHHLPVIFETVFEISNHLKKVYSLMKLL